MKVDIDTTIKALDGQNMMYSDTEPFTFRLAAINALAAEHQSEGSVAPIEKIKRFSLAQRIYNSNGKQDFTIEELDLINKLCGIAYSVVVVGRINEIVNNGSV